MRINSHLEVLVHTQRREKDKIYYSHTVFTHRSARERTLASTLHEIN